MSDEEHNCSDWTPEELEDFRQEREVFLRYWKIQAMAYDMVELCETVRDFVNAHHALDLEYRRRNKEPDGYLYVLRLGTEPPLYKIGRTIDFDSRIRRLKSQVKLPWPLEVVYTFECEDMVDAETHFHRRFAQKRQNGEWFALDDVDLSMEFERFKGRGILYLASQDLSPEPWEPRTRPEWQEPFVDEITKKIV